MKSQLSCVLLVVCLALAGGVPYDTHDECPSLTPEKLTRLMSHLVTEDVHDLIIGDQKEVWGPKQFLLMDPNACLSTTSFKTDDTHINQTDIFKNKGFLDGDQERIITASIEKLKNGVYLIKRGGTEPFGKAYYIYAKDGVVAHYMCKLNTEKEPGRKKWVQPYISYLNVAAADAKIPLDEKVQQHVDVALKVFQSDPELFGEMQQHTHFC